MFSILHNSFRYYIVLYLSFLLQQYVILKILSYLLNIFTYLVSTCYFFATWKLNNMKSSWFFVKTYKPLTPSSPHTQAWLGIYSFWV